MRRSPTLLVLLLFCAAAQSQNEQQIISRQGSVTLMPVYQSWTGKNAGFSFSEASALISAYVPIGRSASFSLGGGGATSGGDVTKLSGLTDVQLGFNYYLESINTVFSLGINAPTGKKELPHDQFVTSILFSHPLFNMQVPAWGQGFNVNPGISWVFPVNDNLVLGLAGAYQYRGKYKPIEGSGFYAPGGEITASLGADYKLNDVASLSADFMLTAYGTDKYNDAEVFASGNSYWANLQYRQYFHENELQVFAGYRSTSKGKVAGVGGLVSEAERLEPGRLEVLGQFKQVFTPRFSMTYLAEVRIYENTAEAYSGSKVAGVGAGPTFSLASGLFFPALLKVDFGNLKGGGSITGVDARIGIGYMF
ncbi:MAG TPA: hypothetical protein VMF59_14265 [Bacteroidota bacterium]|nr:hypothetical protein [Bacteroidota bacterium]